MQRERTLPYLVGLLVGLLLLAGCGQGGDATGLDGVKVTARTGQAPEITLPTTPFVVDEVEVRLASDGDGAALRTGQGLRIRQVAVSGTDGSVLYDGWADEPAAGLVVGENPGVGNLDEVLAEAHVGAQVLVAVPSAGTETATATVADAADVFLIEVAEAYDILAQATGTPVEPDPALPTITVDDAGVPTGMTPTGGEPPTSLVVQPLITGTGEPVAEGQSVTVHYTGWLWDGTQFDSSWDRGTPASFQLVSGGLIDGWVEGLAGQPVGSRVLLVVPPDKGYGDEDNGTIPAGSTLVFVVDILAAG